MMSQNQPQYTFNVGAQDPVLFNRVVSNNYDSMIESEIHRLSELKKQLNAQTQNPKRVQEESIWDIIEKEVASLTDEQKSVLAKDETYISIDRELQFLINKELINLVKDSVAASSTGKELLDKQLKHVRERKAEIIKESNKEMELFRMFQEAVQANPNLTYPEFIKSLNK